MSETTDLKPQPNLEPQAAKGRNVLGLIGMILAIIGFLAACIAPAALLAWLFTLPAVILSIIGLTRKQQKKGMAIAGTVISTVAFLLSIITSSVYAASNASSDHHVSSPPTQQASTQPKPTPSKAQSTPAPPATASYAVLSDHDFALLVKDPAAAKGQKYVLYGVVTQFDAATGTCAFLAGTSNVDQASAYSFNQNTWIDSVKSAGKCPLVTNVVQGDHIKLSIVVEGDYSYDTQAGGNTTVPRVKLTAVEELPAF
jgi:hypothetical protein